MVAEPSLGFHGTFTTDDQTEWLVVDKGAYAGYLFALFDGEYDKKMWDGLSTLNINKQMVIDSATIKSISSDDFVDTKNLFRGYAFGLRINTVATLDANTTDIYSGAGAVGTTERELSIYSLIEIEPNTTYTVSKASSDRFNVGLIKSGASGRVILRDAAKRSLTITTGADDKLLFVQVSEKGLRPKIQIEKGSKATSYESYGRKFKDAAMPIGLDVTKDDYQTDNTFIDLGVQTDRFRYPSGANTYNTDTILNEFYEPLLADYPTHVTKNTLGKDSSGLYDIYEYVFEPDNYEQTILLTSGMHPTERVPPFALGLLINEVYRNPSKHEGLAYLKNKVKIVVIPVVNPWSMNAENKVEPDNYANFRGVNPNRNFPSRWDLVPVNNDPYNQKGEYALSEAEAEVIYTVLNREHEDLSFYFDLHTAQGWIRDSLVYWLEDDDLLRPVMQGVVSMYNDVVRDKYNREPVNLTQETQRALGLYYSHRVLGVPAATIEFGAADTINLIARKRLTLLITYSITCIMH
ncbi:M14 family metallopeptidase [Psychrobacter sp. WY6]|uniref:M14 family metallopeptidase n=1 Tax=Psychrobacter sp. WY6 TaxID=2708350 RepID=UPI002022F2C1|nr:M14 family metallopeptidase [Psychrobacter sp. WY6]